MLVAIAPGIALDRREVQESFVRASGPGGQNVNKVSSAVQLRLDLRGSASLPPALCARAERLGGSRVTNEGVLVLTASRFRAQDRNRQDGLERIVALLREAAVRPVFRVPTRPSRSARRERTDDKAKRGALKRSRGAPVGD